VILLRIKEVREETNEEQLHKENEMELEGTQGRNKYEDRKIEG
jgi:hypothetical protein